VVFVVFFGAILAGVLALAARQRKRRDSDLDRLARQVSGIRCNDTRGAGFRCQLHGASAELWFVTHGSGSSAESWTEIDVVLPKLYPLAMHVRRHEWLDTGSIERGMMVDVVLGEPAFDDEFLVEVAPADVARLLLDEPVRRLLEQHSYSELKTVTDHDRRILRLAVKGWLEDPKLALPALDQVARIGGRVREAYASVEAATAAGSDVGSPYRPIIDDRAAREAADARAAEVHSIEALRAARAARSKTFTTIAVTVIAGLIGLMWLGML
ncbi:MAG: hypothetical protein ABI867_33285, partial [Kofleriaceae bacterium]